MLLIPLKAVPSQIVTARLASQTTQINVYQKAYGLFVDVYVNNNLLIAGVICRNLTKIVRSTYLGFVGDLYFYDSHGPLDPYYTGLGSRFQLAYWEVSDQ